MKHLIWLPFLGIIVFPIVLFQGKLDAQLKNGLAIINGAYQGTMLGILLLILYNI